MVSISPLIRILLRMFGGIMIGAGFSENAVTDIVTDPELVGLLCWLISEAWYRAAKKYGWTT